MPGRNGGEDYRHGFNGMERDDEIKGAANSLDFGARIYDPRLGRWLSVDPLHREFADQSPYKAANNCPVTFLDPDGLAEFLAITVNNKVTGRSYTVIVVLDAKKIEKGPDVWSPTLGGHDISVRNGYYHVIHQFTLTISNNGKHKFIYTGKPRSQDPAYTTHKSYAGQFLEALFSDHRGQGGFQQGGFYLTDNGEGGVDPTKFKALHPEDVKVLDIGPLNAAFTFLAKKYGTDNPNLLKALGKVKDIFQALLGKEQKTEQPYKAGELSPVDAKPEEYDTIYYRVTQQYPSRDQTWYTTKQRQGETKPEQEKER